MARGKTIWRFNADYDKFPHEAKLAIQQSCWIATATRKDQTMLKPFNTKFNVAVLRMAELVCPMGYDVVDNAPQSLPELTEHIARTRRITVERSNSDATIFGCPEANWAFRAWHDWTHFIMQAPFTLEGELAVAHRQIEDMYRVFGYCREADDFSWLILEEVYGQACYKEKYGNFPQDQREFARRYLAGGNL